MTYNERCALQRQSNPWGLTVGEQEVVELLATEGLTAKVIAGRLGKRTYGTVKAHLYEAYKKMGVDNALQAALKWHGLLKGDPNPRFLPHARYRKDATPFHCSECGSSLTKAPAHARPTGDAANAH